MRPLKKEDFINNIFIAKGNLKGAVEWLITMSCECDNPVLIKYNKKCKSCILTKEAFAPILKKEGKP